MNINELATQSTVLLNTFQANMPIVLSAIALLWGIHVINILLGYRLNILGILPRHPWGLIGIPCFSFLHADFNHLFFNSIPLFMLLTLTLANGVMHTLYITLTIVGIGGLLIWLLGRKAIHIGASSLIMGYFAYLLANAYQHPTIMTFILALICVYYLGSLFLNLFPTGKNVSWESHVFGFVGGLVAAYIIPA